jgi:hypothetical protein
MTCHQRLRFLKYISKPTLKTATIASTSEPTIISKGLKQDVKTRRIVRLFSAVSWRLWIDLMTEEEVRVEREQTLAALAKRGLSRLKRHRLNSFL